MVNIYGEVDNGVTLVHIKKFSSLPLTICAHKTGIQAVAYRGGGWGVQTPPKFRRYRWSPRSQKQEEPASRFPFIVHCVLIRL